MRVGGTLKTSKISEKTGRHGRVTSSQAGIHIHLERHLRRHLATGWRQPLHQPTVEAFRQLVNNGALSDGAPLILDSGCGTGSSSLTLARLNPGHLVIGVDQSIARLSKSGAGAELLQKENCLLIRAELSAFWRLLFDSGIGIERHYLLYPNPWPKPAQLKRRWHGHPVFPVMVALGGDIELRCNWEIYAREFAHAVNCALNTRVMATSIKPDGGLSPFERKYLAWQQPLFAVKVPARETRKFRAGWRPAPLEP